MISVEDTDMAALIDLFTSFSGLLSLGIIAFVCVMAGFFIRLALRNMEQGAESLPIRHDREG
jgi:hypothetical protein